MSTDFNSNFISKSLIDTGRYADSLVEFLNNSIELSNVVGLIGDLGAGKTNLTNSIAKSLGVKECLSSPTFVLMKVYEIPKKIASNGRFKRLVHVDAYRLENIQSTEELGLVDYICDSESLVVIEWADKVKSILPKNANYIILEHVCENERHFRLL